MDQEKANEILNMYTKGMSIPAIMSEMGVSRGTVQRIVKAQGGEKPSAPKLDEVGVVESYEAGEPIGKILADFGIGRPKLYYLLSKYQVASRKVSMETARSRAMDEAISLYQQGVVVRQITEDTGIHQPTLHAELARRSIPLRRPRVNS